MKDYKSWAKIYTRSTVRVYSLKNYYLHWANIVCFVTDEAHEQTYLYH